MNHSVSFKASFSSRRIKAYNNACTHLAAFLSRLTVTLVCCFCGFSLVCRAERFHHEHVRPSLREERRNKTQCSLTAAGQRSNTSSHFLDLFLMSTSGKKFNKHVFISFSIYPHQPELFLRDFFFFFNQKGGQLVYKRRLVQNSHHIAIKGEKEERV